MATVVCHYRVIVKRLFRSGHSVTSLSRYTIRCLVEATVLCHWIFSGELQPAGGGTSCSVIRLAEQRSASHVNSHISDGVSTNSGFRDDLILLGDEGRGE